MVSEIDGVDDAAVGEALDDVLDLVVAVDGLA